VRRRHAYYLTRLARKHADTSRFEPLVHRDWPDRPSWTTLPVSPDLGDSDA
jgi:hypothetical protein